MSQIPICLTERHTTFTYSYLNSATFGYSLANRNTIAKNGVFLLIGKIRGATIQETPILS